MATTTRKIPTSADIYLEINGTRVAVVQSYQVTAKRTSQTVEAFGQEEPVATIRGQTQYALSLSRLYATDEALRDGISFMDLTTSTWSSASPTARSSTRAASGRVCLNTQRWAAWCWRKFRSLPPAGTRQRHDRAAVTVAGAASAACAQALWSCGF